MAASVLPSYVEQIQTTFETMRRRGLVAYDTAVRGAVYLEKALRELPKQLKDAQKSKLIKEIYHDVLNIEPLNLTNESRRTTLQEMYYGLAILSVAISAGEMTGVLLSASIISSIFDPFIELLLIALLSVYAYLHLVKRKAYDAIERRSWMFGLVFAMCCLLGDLSGALIFTANPSMFFIPPLLLALLIDVKFSPSSFYANRQLLLSSLVVGAFFITQALAFLSGMTTFVGVLVSMVNALLLVVHFQIMESRAEDKRFGHNESQLLYVAGVLLTQLLLALMFGYI